MLAGAVQWALFHLTGLAGFVSLDGRQGAGTAGLALFVGDIGGAFAAAAVTGAVSAALDELDSRRRVSVLHAYTLAGRHARATRRHWWRTFAITALVDVIAILSGPLLGVLILLLTAQSLIFIDIIGSVVYTLVVPYAAIALTLYYFDLQERQSRRSRQ
jgi:hypothetical protein